MNERSDIDGILTVWFDDGPTVMPDRVVSIVADRIGQTRQRSRWRLDRRLHDMNPFLKLGAAIAAVVLIVLVGFTLIPSRNDVGAPAPTASPTPRPSDLPTGRLEAGRYIAHAFPGDPMDIAVSVATGWNGFGGFAITGPTGSSGPTGVMVALMHSPQLVSDPCTPSDGSASPGGPQTVDDLVEALSSFDGISVTDVTDATLGGYAGKRVAIDLPRDIPCGPYYVFDEPQGLYAQGPGDHWQVWIVDVGGETAVVAMTSFAGTPPEDLAAAQVIVDSIEIDP